MTDRVLNCQWHLSECLIMSIRLEDGIPSEHVLTARLDDLAGATAREHNRLSVGTLAEGEDALGVGCLIIEVLDHLPETGTSDTSQEVLTIIQIAQR